MEERKGGEGIWTREGESGEGKEERRGGEEEMR